VRGEGEGRGEVERRGVEREEFEEEEGVDIIRGGY